VENKDDDSLLLKVSIEDSEVNIHDRQTNQGRVGDLIFKLLKTCSFQGGSEFFCSTVVRNNNENDTLSEEDDSSDDDDDEHWLLSSELTLKLVVPLGSRLFPVPPGFNSIGSRIVKSTVQKRLKETMSTLVEEYHAFTGQGNL